MNGTSKPGGGFRGWGRVGVAVLAAGTLATACGGSDVPQVYVGPSSQLGVGIQQAVRRLVQFQRVELAPGQFQDLTLHVTPHSLSSWSSAQQQWVVGTGPRTVYVGPPPRDLPLSATVTAGAR